MIIESAFYKLPDYFLSEKAPQLSYENQLVTYFVLSIFLELQNRGIDNPFLNIQLGRRYPKVKNKSVDIFVNIPWLEQSLNKKSIASNYYHVFKENWIEVKFFGAIERTKKVHTRNKTFNVRKIIDDLLRLRFYAPFNAGRYFLVGFNRKPQDYLAFSSQRQGERSYLKGLFQMGEHEINFDLINEPEIFKRKIFNNWKTELKLKESKNILSLPIKFKLNISTLKIEPKGAYSLPDRPCFWLYLIKIPPRPDEMKV